MSEYYRGVIVFKNREEGKKFMESIEAEKRHFEFQHGVWEFSIRGVSLRSYDPPDCKYVEGCFEFQAGTVVEVENKETIRFDNYEIVYPEEIDAPAIWFHPFDAESGISEERLMSDFLLI